MGLAQRALAPMLNFLVERFFPKGIFYGADYLKVFKEDGWEEMGPTGSAAFLVVSSLRESGDKSGLFEFFGVTSNGERVGDWLLKVEKVSNIKQSKEGE